MKALLEPKEAYEQQFEANTIVLDVRKPHEYAQGHLERAHHLTREALQPHPPTLITQPQLESVLRNLGVNHNTTLILTDGRGGYDACYLWFLLRVYGFHTAAVVSGGYEGCVFDRVPLTTALPATLPVGDVALSPRLDTHYADYAVVTQATSTTALLDVRSIDEFQGKPPAYDQCRLGRIPNSVHLDYREALDQTKGNKFKTKQALLDCYQEYLKQPVIVYCQVGVRSALTFFVLTALLDHPNVKNYAGSWLDYNLHHSF